MMNPDALTRLAEALRTLSEREPEPVEMPSSWLRRGDGRWSPVYDDGMVGDSFSFIEMIAFKGEDIGEILESLISAGLVTDVRTTGAELFEDTQDWSERIQRTVRCRRYNRQRALPDSFD